MKYSDYDERYLIPMNDGIYIMLCNHTDSSFYEEIRKIYLINKDGSLTYIDEYIENQDTDFFITGDNFGVATRSRNESEIRIINTKK